MNGMTTIVPSFAQPFWQQRLNALADLFHLYSTENSDESASIAALLRAPAARQRKMLGASTSRKRLLKVPFRSAQVHRRDGNNRSRIGGLS